MNWKETKRKQREMEWQAEMEKRQAEEARKERLSMWERIEEMSNPEDVKDILHRIATHVGLESE